MTGRWLSIFTLGVIASVASCATDFHARTCGTDSDCGGGLSCVEQPSSPAVCVAPANAPIRIGMSGPITGPNQELGTEMKKGVTLAFNEQNSRGGVRGRPISLDFLDDEYEPTAAASDARQLLDVTQVNAPARCPTTTTAIVAGNAPVATGELDRGPTGTLGLLGNIGTPTMVVTAPVALETHSLFFGALTGATTLLRDTSAGPCSKYIFNVRASYAQEARATVEYFLSLGMPDSKHLVSFDQNDSFGDAGYNGLLAAYQALKGNITNPYASGVPIARFRYTRNDDASVPVAVTAATAYLGQILNADQQPHTIGIFMTDTYGPGADFITGVRNWQYANDAEQTQNQKATRLTLYFSNVSFVAPNTLAARLVSAGTVQTPHGAQPYSNNVFVSQVVPNYQSDQSDAVLNYMKLLNQQGLQPSFTSLEGYLVGRIFAAGLVANTGPMTPDALIPAFEALPALNLGLGASAGFGPGDHNYSKAIFGTAIAADGSFTNIYYWSDGNAIQLFE